MPGMMYLAEVLGLESILLFLGHFDSIHPLFWVGSLTCGVSRSIPFFAVAMCPV